MSGNRSQKVSLSNSKARTLKSARHTSSVGSPEHNYSKMALARNFESAQ